MMEMMISAIGSVGFPIAACCGMFYLFNEFKTLLNEMNITLTRICDKLELEEGK